MRQCLLLFLLLTVARAAPPPTGDFVEIDFADEEDDEFPLFDDPADAVAPVKPAAAAAAAVDVPPPVVGDELFEDEFGDASPPPQLGAAASSAKGARAQRINSASKPRGPPPPPKTFKMEGAFLVLLVVYLFAYLRGSGVNAEIAQKWLDRFVGEPSSAEFKSRARVLRREFEIVGAVGTIATDDVIGMSFANFQSSYSDYALWATGRRNCRGMLAHLNLRRRQDLLSTIVLETLGMSATRDVLTLDFILNDGEAEPFVFALLRSANKDGFLAKTRGSDVKELCGSSKHYAKKKLVALYASSEVERHVMMPAVVKTVTENADLFRSMVFSDSRVDSTSEPLEPVQLETKTHLEFKFALPRDPLDADENDKLEKLVKMACGFVDHMKRLKLTTKAKAKAVKRRSAKAKSEAAAERAEKLAAQRAEERKEKASKYALMSTENKRKQEAKDNAEKLKRMMKRRVKKA